VAYPQITEYQDAVQDPRNSFTDPELKSGLVATNPLGLPLALSGGFALTYTVTAGSKKFAVRCFHREVPQAQSRYAQISTTLRSLGSTYFVNFDFQPKGILILGKRYPVVKMDWAEGDTLGTYLDRWASSAPALAALRRSFSGLADFLHRNGIAHGDIQNENVIVMGSAPRLIDYDGMFVTGMPQGQGAEVGHKHFQHPGRTPSDFGPDMDRFSFIVLDVSLEAMQADTGLHRKFREGGQAIIFKANDFADPASSEVFRLLNGLPALRQSAGKLAAICGAPLSAVPTLADFVAGRNIPTAKAETVGSKSKPTVAPGYIAAFPVLDARRFGDVMRAVGDKVELVGKIVSVKQGTGKKGRGKGKPYVFVNFGVWNQESVKITIWSEGLGNMTDRPTEAWVGRWISVTGLVEPPYEGKHYGRSYRNVGITVVSGNEIISLSEREAKFRLAPAQPSRTKPGPSKSPNEDILKKLQGVGSAEPMTRRKTTVGQPASVPVSPKTRNEQILRGLQGTPTSQPQTRATANVSQPSMLGRIPKWVWIAGGLLLFWLVAGGK
jgi:hypothetical protein